MKLSTAIMLGSATCKMEPCNINSCAYGAALNALGVPEDSTFLPNGDVVFRYVEMKKFWPWIVSDLEGPGVSTLATSVYQKFDDEVCEGKMTLEQLVEYVRSIEPQCGDCNRFECTCAKTEAVPESVVVEVA